MLSLQHSYGIEEHGAEHGNSSVVARQNMSEDKINRMHSNTSRDISHQEGILLQVILCI